MRLSRSFALLHQCIRQYLDWVERNSAGTIFDLMPATCAGCCDDGVSWRRPYCWQQDQFSDLHGNLEMLFFISERASHAAATGWNNLDFVIHW